MFTPPPPPSTLSAAESTPFSARRSSLSVDTSRRYLPRDLLRDARKLESGLEVGITKRAHAVGMMDVACLRRFHSFIRLRGGGSCWLAISYRLRE